MSDHRKPSATLLLRFPGKTGVKCEIFFASLFEQNAEGFRLRIDGAWLDKEKIHVADFKELGAWIAAELGKGMGVELDGEEREGLPYDIKPGDRLSVRKRLEGGYGPWMGAYAKASPIRCADGEWRVPVQLWGRVEYILLRDVATKKRQDPSSTGNLAEASVGVVGVNHG